MIAYYYNLPVIASDISGFVERVEDNVNGFIFKKNNIQSLCNVIIKATSLTKEEYDAMKQNLHSYAETNFGLPNVSKRYINFFNSIKKNK